MPERRFYYPQCAARHEDGTVEMRVSIYDEESHSSGTISLSPARQGQDEYEFWLWLIQRFPQMEGPFVSSDALGALRTEFDNHKLVAGSELVDVDEILSSLPLIREQPRRERFSLWLLNLFLKWTVIR